MQNIFAFPKQSEKNRGDFHVLTANNEPLVRHSARNPGDNDFIGTRDVSLPCFNTDTRSRGRTYNTMRHLRCYTRRNCCRLCLAHDKPVV